MASILGELNVTFDDAGKLTEAAGEPLMMDAAVTEDAETVARIAELAVPLDEIRNKVVAEAAGPIEGERDICRVQECEMGNLVADAMLARVADQGVQIAIANSGGLRACIDAGEVTMGEVLTVLPFQNTLSTFEVSGADDDRRARERRQPGRGGRGPLPAGGGAEIHLGPRGGPDGGPGAAGDGRRGR